MHRWLKFQNKSAAKSPFCKIYKESAWIYGQIYFFLLFKKCLILQEYHIHWDESVNIKNNSLILKVGHHILKKYILIIQIFSHHNARAVWQSDFTSISSSEMTQIKHSWRFILPQSVSAEVVHAVNISPIITKYDIIVFHPKSNNHMTAHQSVTIIERWHPYLAFPTTCTIT